MSEGSLLDRAVTIEPILGAGASGARLSHLSLEDGRQLVLKEIHPDWDWMMGATSDTGRAAELWTSGAMDRCPPSIDPAIVAIERSGAGAWRLYMRDVGADFLRSGTRVPRAQARQVLAALSDLHAAFWNRPAPGLCRLVDLLLLTAPATIERLGTEHPFLAAADAGWHQLDEFVPADVSGAVRAILRDPTPLANALEAEGCTLVHSDPHFGNIAPLADRIVLLDWSLAAWAPPAVDLAWFLDTSAEHIDAAPDELLDDFRTLEGDRHSDAALDLAMLAQVVLSGWAYPERAEHLGRERLERHLGWWIERARAGVGRLAAGRDD